MNGSNNPSRLRLPSLCTRSSCRNQVGEERPRRVKRDCIETFTADTRKHGLNPLTEQVMAEAIVDISRQKDHRIKYLTDIAFHCVVTLRDVAREMCRFFPDARRSIHVDLDDPSPLCSENTDDEERFVQYRRARDDINAFVEGLSGAVENGAELWPDDSQGIGSVAEPLRCERTG